MKSELLFSVILPVYNVREYLDSALLSLSDQLFSGFEVIAVNDGSTDGSDEILEQWLTRDIRLEVIHQSNQGLSAARNRGIERANGRYLLFLDSDDELEPTALSTLENSVRTHEPDILTFSLGRIDEKGTGMSRSESLEQPLIAEPVAGETFFTEQVEAGRFLAMAPAYVCKKELLWKHHLRFDVGFVHEDEGFTPRVLYLAGSLISTDKVLYRYRIRNDSIMTSRYSLRHVKGGFKAASSLISFSMSCKKGKTREMLRVRARALVKEGCNKMDTIAERKKSYLPLLLSLFAIREVPHIGFRLLFRLSLPALYNRLKLMKHQ